MAYSNPNIPTVDILEQDPITGDISRGTVKGTPPAGAAYAGLFSLECELIDIEGSGIYQNTGTVAVPAWTLQGSGASGISELIGDVTAGPGSGQQTATVVGVNGLAIDTYGFQDGTNTHFATFVPLGTPQALSGAGACTISSYQTKFTSTATGNALTLANGTIGGQIKRIDYVAEAAGPDTGVITPLNAIGFTTATLNAVGDYVAFIWVAVIGWSVLESKGITLA